MAFLLKIYGVELYMQYRYRYYQERYKSAANQNGRKPRRRWSVLA